MQRIEIKTEYIKLGQFLKFANVISSGAQAKDYLIDAEIYVNGEKESRRGKKLYDGDIVEVENNKYIIVLTKQ